MRIAGPHATLPSTPHAGLRLDSDQFLCLPEKRILTLEKNFLPSLLSLSSSVFFTQLGFVINWSCVHFRVLMM